MRLSRSYRIIFQRPQSDFARSAACLGGGTLREARSLLRRATPTNDTVGREAAVVDMQVNPVGLTLGPMATDEHPLRIDEPRLEQLMLWHGTDESNLPPAHTLQNLSRDTLAALGELRDARETIEHLRAAMGRAFWATEFPEVHAILLDALGPPPDEYPT
jgi:hypothetical protein